MPRSTALAVKIVLFAAAGVGFVGCGFAPAGNGGAGAATGGPLGTGNASGTGLVGGGAAQNGQAAVTGMNCAEKQQPLAKLPPDILIVLDASGSMNEDTNNQSCSGGCGANSKWALLTPALNQVVMQTETTVNWGLKLFADTDSTCGVSPNNVAVQVGAGNAGEIANVITGRTAANMGVTNGSRTPTRSAENAAVNYLNTVNDANPKFILLATDGQPNCPMSGDTANDDTPGAVMSVANAQGAGYPTFVVGISAPAGAANDALNMMAVAGGYPRAGSPQYYPVSSAAEFIAVLQTLVGVATTCTFTVPDPPNDMTDRSHIGVVVNGKEIPRDPNHADGWDYTNTGMTAVQVYGNTCTGIMNGSITDVKIVFKCIIN
jgi:hypothetical protein